MFMYIIKFSLEINLEHTEIFLWNKYQSDLIFLQDPWE